MRHAVIMAGGAGTRLWPLSRQQRPKQVLKLFSGRSLIRESFERVASLLPSDSIYVITNQVHLSAISEELPEVPPANLFGEPVARDTAAAVGLSAAIIARRDPDATIGVFTADHIIKPLERFRLSVETAFKTAEDHDDALVTMGIIPTRADVNYGYVHKGDRVASGVFSVRQFAEKPDAETAARYLESGEYYWNSGMFAWRASAILAQIQKHLPEAHDPLRELGDSWGGDGGVEKLERLYPKLPKISIDYAVMERADRVLVVEMDCRWIDVGAWLAIESIIDADDSGNVSACKKVIHLDSKGTIAVSEDEHLIATIGVEDLVIVHSPDATLVCRKCDAARLKELVGAVGEAYGDQYA